MLLDLPYFDIIAHCAIDPMHNLFLGTSKHVMEMWQKLNIINSKDLLIIQDRVNSMTPPCGVGRIPAKISSNFCDFTADEWKNWTLIYSIYALNGILPKEEMSVWELYVKACNILCTRFITIDNVKLAHCLLHQFNCSFEEMHGSEYCSINMHLSCHLAETIINFGPIYAFWCFPYERFNGILGAYTTNNHSINVQIMRKFALHQFLDKYVLDSGFLLQEYKEYIMSNLSEHFTNVSSGSLRLQQLDFNLYNVISAHRNRTASGVTYSASDNDKLCGCIYEGAFSDAQFECLNQLYSSLYVNSHIMHISRIYQRASDVELYSTNECYSSSTSISKMSNCAYVLNTTSVPPRIQLCTIQYFVKHSISFEKSGIASPLEHISAYIQWFEILSELHQEWLGDTVDVWSPNVSQHCYVSVQQIQCKAAIARSVLNFGEGIEHEVIISVPVHKLM